MSMHLRRSRMLMYQRMRGSMKSLWRGRGRTNRSARRERWQGELGEVDDGELLELVGGRAAWVRHLRRKRVHSLSALAWRDARLVVLVIMAMLGGICEGSGSTSRALPRCLGRVAPVSTAMGRPVAMLGCLDRRQWWLRQR